MHSHEIELGCFYYGLVTLVLMAAGEIYRHDRLNPVFAALLLFVFFVPLLLVAIIQRGDHPWANWLLKWHVRASACILVLAALTLFVHWRGVP